MSYTIRVCMVMPSYLNSSDKINQKKDLEVSFTTHICITGSRTQVKSTHVEL